MPPEQLPDTFALETELDIAGAHYFFVRAEPQTKAEFAKTKQLTIGLRRVELVDPQKILFSLPTICGSALPMASSAPISGDVVVLHEDDWRQCEFVASSLIAEISAELAAIRRIHCKEAAAVGWRKIHVRERIAHPLPDRTTWSSVIELLGPSEQIGGVSFHQKDNVVATTRTARLADGVVVWGVADAEALTALCVENLDGASPSTIAACWRA